METNDGRWVIRVVIPVMFAGVLAFNSSSTNYYLRGNVESSSGGTPSFSYSSSTSFKSVGAGGELATGTSTSGTSFNLYSGILRSLFKPVYPVYALVHFHWRNDNGSESAATSATGGIADTTLTNAIKSTIYRLRAEISNEGGTEEAYSAQQFRIEYGLKSSTCSAISSWTDVGAVGGDWDMANSSNLTNGNATTNIASGVGGVTDENKYFIGTGGQLDTSSQSGSVSVPSHTYIELEYSMAAQSAATDGATYCFRITNAGTATNYLYSSYPQVTLSGGALTLVVTTNNFSSATPGTAVFATSTILVNTPNSSGWLVYLSGDQKDSTHNNLQLSGDAATQIPDQKEWVPGTATTSAGNAARIASLIPSSNVLAFRVMSASGTVAFRAGSWWGTADTYTDNASTLWGGIASSTVSRAIGNSNVSSGGSDAINSVIYYLNVPSTQKTGSYTAPLTYTAVNNP